MAGFFRASLGSLLRRVLPVVAASGTKSVDTSSDSAHQPEGLLGSPTDDCRCTLTMDNIRQKIVGFTSTGCRYDLSNVIPSIVGHTKVGYAFKFQNADNSAFKHFKRAEFSNKNLAKSTVDFLDKQGVHWMWMQDAKTSDQRGTIPYLFQELCSDYDSQEENKKKKMEIATNTGFHGRIFIYDRNHQVSLDTMKWLGPESLVVLEPKANDELDFIMNTNVSLEESKTETVKLTKMLATCWPIEQVLLVRAGHAYAQTAPYSKSVADIITPLFLQYGQFNTGKTTMLSYLSAMHGVRNGRVQKLNLSKLSTMLTTSSCVFVPVDDPTKDLLDNIAEAVYNGGGMKNNRAGSSLSAQEPIRLPALSTKEFMYSKGVWSKVIIISAPELENTSPERQQDVEDMAPKMYKHGEECVLYLLSFAQVWNDWDESKTKYLRMAREVIPEEMLVLSRTARNFSFLLPFVDKMLNEEHYDTSMDKVLEFANASFLRLLPKIQVEEMSSSPPIAANVSPAGAIPVSSTAALPPVVVKLLDFLERQQQVKNWVRQLEKAIDGVGYKPIAIRGAATTLANATDFGHDLAKLNINTVKKRNIRFLHEDSPVPFFKLGPKAVIQAGRVRTTTAILFSSDSTIAKPFLHLLKNQEERDGPTEEDDDDIDLADQVHQPGSPAPGVETETGAMPTAEATPAPPALLPTPAEVSATPTTATPTTTATNTTIATPTTTATLTITATPTTTTASGSGIGARRGRGHKRTVADDDLCLCTAKCLRFCSCKEEKRKCGKNCHPKNKKCQNT